MLSRSFTGFVRRTGNSVKIRLQFLITEYITRVSFPAKSTFSKASFPTNRRGSFFQPAKKRLNISEDLKARVKKANAERRKLFKQKSKKMLPFVPMLSQSVQHGRTIVSFRLHAYPFYPKPGQEFVANCEHSALPGTYLCTRRIRTTLRIVRDRYWKDVGMPSPAAYENLMRDILRKPVLDLSAKGFLYVFERIS